MNQIAARCLVTAILLGVVAATQHVILPGVDRALFADMLEGTTYPMTTVSIGALGVMSWMSAYILVELGLFLRPGWRALRETGFAGRDRIDRVVTWVWLGCVVFQSYVICVSLESMRHVGASLVIAPGWSFRVVAMLTLIAGNALLGLAARVSGRYGIGSGFAPFLFFLYPGLEGLRSVPQLVAMGELSLALVLATALAVLLAVAATVALVVSREPRTGMPTAFAGTIPASHAIAAWGLLTLLGVAGPSAVVPAILAAAYAAVIGWWLLPYWRPGTEVARQADMRSAIVKQALFGGLVTLLMGWWATSALRVDVLGLLLVVAVAWDLVEEGRARLADPSLSPVWVASGVLGAEAAVTALQAAGIPASVLGFRYRQLVQVFGAAVPLEILVPAARVADAQAVLAAEATTSATPSSNRQSPRRTPMRPGEPVGYLHALNAS